MSDFWDRIIFSSQAEPVVEAVVSDFWASLGLGVESKPVKQSKVKVVKETAKQGKSVERIKKAVVEAERVYETVKGLVVPADDCKHHWMIPSDSAWAIGVCKLCQGEKWFSNRSTEQYQFNDTLIPPTIQNDITRALNTGIEFENSLANKVTAEEGI